MNARNVLAPDLAAPSLPVHEQFLSWQGEGAHLGRSAYFVRLYGCPLQCPWCDSAGTWHPGYLPSDIARESPASIAQRAADSGAELVVVTGGEPTIHDLADLANALSLRGLAAHLETSGSFGIRGRFDWVTLSPKWARLPLPENLERASELKLIVEDANSVEKWIQFLGPALSEERPVWLQPEWSQRSNREVLDAISRTVRERGAPFRAGYQVHKLYRADDLDRRVHAPIPLGGDPSKGY